FALAAAVGAAGLARLAARLAALGDLAESFLLVELLLAGGEDELVLAIDALQRAILKFHHAPRSKKPPRRATRGFNTKAVRRDANESPSSLYDSNARSVKQRRRGSIARRVVK